VEGEVGYFRRNHLVPVPQVESLEELNQVLLAACRADEQRRIMGKPHTVGEALRIEREHLLPLAAEGFELAETSFPVVDGKGCVKVRTNWYSTPLKSGTRTRVKLLPAYVEIWQERECVAQHERSFSRYQQVLDLEHYLDVLERKPGALAGSSPLAQWRQHGRWPGELRLFVAELARAARAAGRHAGDDRAAHAGQAPRLGRAETGDRAVAGVGLLGCGRGPASGHRRRTRPLTPGVVHPARVGTL
jgi:hypothetical protein